MLAVVILKVDFGGHLKAQMIIEDGKLKVTAAMNGWGDPVDVSTVKVHFIITA